MTKAEWAGLKKKLQFRAFTMAKLGTATEIETAKQILAGAVEKGETYAESWQTLKDSLGGNPSFKPGYWETVFRTNTQSAYMAGKLEKYAGTGAVAYQLLVIEDERTSKICRHLLVESGYGAILPVGHRFWQKYGFSPYHFNCRTSVCPIYSSQVAKTGYIVEDIPMNRFAKFKPQKGFGGNPLERGSFWDMTDSMKKQAAKFGLMDIFSKERRILGITDKPIKHKTIKETKRIGTITKGDNMTFEEANGGKVNPFVSLGGGYKENCQVCVAVFEARLKGFNIRAKAYDGTNIQFKRLANNPLRAFIDPNTRHHPEWPDDIPLFKDWKDCLNYTKNTVKRGQRYIMQFNWIDRTEGHVISVIRSSKGKFFFYDPQEGAIFNREDFKDLFEQIMFSDKYKQPKYIRVDHLQFDENVLKYITEASDE